MGKIASLNDLKSNFSVGGGGSKCPTKSEIVALGLTVSGSYSSNQLVQLSDISRGYYLTINNIGDYGVYLFDDSTDFSKSDMYKYDKISPNLDGSAVKVLKNPDQSLTVNKYGSPQGSTVIPNGGTVHIVIVRESNVNEGELILVKRSFMLTTGDQTYNIR